ncbi:uncharacterized protein SPPG_04400 [Spizellomyces punctatus DAOM BR117]|uniref:Peptidase S8/S53 domain-containing protein n=1 Tax=Spizellomyces punctatus (strain DAOM BR117) TaxID=645134 RepID=A0A0L0HF14_SPIPD|nr:uncharacterized protein SPPG_04400 [Spizellomyces punctatus DAOM BR117]KND00056.1 hypothetical protein SPPG_04400 [Spizellomyces punctatus DAOM BR117]|eukprot:XP_016608095.1 hypothetical protein SPPG_04400 [Spizellomyces punctatus DAOM BR117]
MTAVGDRTVTPSLESAHGLTGVLDVHDKLKIYGKGVKVGVIDSGVYYKHPALGGGFGPGFKVEKGWDFVGDAYTGLNEPIEDADPIDECSDVSHGTHVAGIIAANATGMAKEWAPVTPFLGVAPQATLGAYRVFGCDGSAGDDVIAKAIYRGHDDGMDILNLSLGGGSPYPDSPAVFAADRVSSKGTYVIMAAGNDGEDGVFTTGPPAVAPKGWSIASIDNSKLVQFSIFDDAGKSYSYAPSSAGGGWVGKVKGQIVINNPNADPTTTLDDGCKPVTIDAKGKVIIFQQGSACGSAVRCGNAKAAGAAGCLVYNNVPGSINIFGTAGLPGGGLDDQTGLAIVNAVKAQPNRVWTFTNELGISDVPTARTPSSFTSLGLDGDLKMKPELAGIGGNVYSTASKFAGAKAGMPTPYLSMSGTSMATPYVAGTVALFVQARGKLDTELVKAYFQNNAKPVHVSNKGDDATRFASVAQQGAGLVDIFETINTRTLIQPSRIALNDTLHHNGVQRISITNNYDSPTTYKLSDFGAVALTGSEKGSDRPLAHPVHSNEKATIMFSQKEVTIPAGKTVTINAVVIPPITLSGDLWPIYSGFINVQPVIASKKGTTNAAPLTIPYVGMRGDYSRAPTLLKKDPKNGPTIGAFSVKNNTLAPLANPITINPTQSPVVIRLAFAYPTREAFVDIVPASLLAPKPKTHLVTLGSQGRSYGTADKIDIPWSGEKTLDVPAGGVPDNSTVPAGKYKIRISALKHFANPKLPFAYDTWESPVITVKY